MDKTIWIVISASVAIALAGIVLSISGGEISTMLDDQDETVDNHGCSFQEDQFECGDAGLSDRCAEYIGCEDDDGG